MIAKSTARRLKKTLRQIAIRGELLVVPALYDYIKPLSARHIRATDHILIAAPGNGNIGDQAMLASFLENSKGTVTVIVRDMKDVQIPAEVSDRVELLELSNLIYGHIGLRHLRHTATFMRLVDNNPRVSIVGADTMDGAYNLLASIRRSNMAFLAARAGADTRILGFSLNAKPAAEALSALRRGSAAGVRLMLRDPVSFKRGLDAGLNNVYESADIVFSSHTTENIHASGGLDVESQLALVNISAHIQSSFDQIEDYAITVRHLVDRGFQVLLVPHVSRIDSDDIILAKRLESTIRDPRVTALNELMKPSQIRSLCKRADIIVTGRMHLSVIGLSEGVPAIILASQGKVEGLVSRFDGHSFEITPSVGMHRYIQAGIDKIIDEGVDVAKFREQIIHSQKLATSNFLDDGRNVQAVSNIPLT